jgi:hypothetical protein
VMAIEAQFPFLKKTFLINKVWWYHLHVFKIEILCRCRSMRSKNLIVDKSISVLFECLMKRCKFFSVSFKV